MNTNRSVTIRNLEFCDYPLVYEDVSMSVYTSTRRNCGSRGKCFETILEQKFTLKLPNVDPFIAEDIKRSKSVIIDQDDDTMLWIYKDYNPSTKVLVLTSA